MAITKSAGASQKQVFISYSHEPAENLTFVRWLAGNLRIAGFMPWLDEEQIPGGADVKEAIGTAVEQTDVVLFVVTRRWEERPFTKHEVELFGQRDEVRKVILEREPTVLKKLGPYLTPLKRVAWSADDPERTARFWEIYCGIEGKALGPVETWGEQGAIVLRATHAPSPVATPGRAPEEKAPAAPKPAVTAPTPVPSRVPLFCKGKPISSLAGEDWTYLLTDQQEWVGIRADGRVHAPVAGLAEHAAAIVNASGRLLVGLYSWQIARLGERDWEYLAQEGPVLSLCACPAGDLVGTAGGAIILVNGETNPLPVLRMRDPVIGLAAYEGGVVALGSRGVFGRVPLPLTGNDSLKWIDAGPVGRPAGFFTTVEQNCVGVFSPTRLAVLEPASERLTMCPRIFEAGIRSVTFLGARRWPYAVLTDEGTLVLVDTGLLQTKVLSFSSSPKVLGCSSGGWRGSATAWTEGGSVYRISSDGVSTRIAQRDAVLSYSPASEDGAVHVVRWTAEDGAVVEILR